MKALRTRVCRHDLDLAAERVAKLPRDHAERGFDVAALVVVREKFFTAIGEDAEGPKLV